MNRIACRVMFLVWPLAMLTTGCGRDDRRLVEQAREASQRQADQNRQIAHQNHQLAEATNRLIEADAESRKELVGLERDLQTERFVIDRARDELEDERREIAKDRCWDSAAGDAVGGAAVLIGGALPLVLCWLLLRGLWGGPDDQGLGDLLTEELASDSPMFLPPDEDSPPGSSRKLPLPPAEE